MAHKITILSSNMFYVKGRMVNMRINEMHDESRVYQAETKARDLLKRQSFSINDLIREVETEGFTRDEADEGVLALIQNEINGKRGWMR